MVAVPQKERERSQWQFGNPVTFSDKPKPPVPSGGVQVRAP
jgi:hypothetical protein